jgi:acyl-coenzyme A synthetase/AMP-(fatty) acid ligase
MFRSLFEQGDCWFRSGDLLRHDADGYIHFVGRLVQTTKIGGEYVSFPHVEDEVLAHCEIDDCCVAAVKVPDGKEIDLAVLVRTREPAAFAEISKKLDRVKQARSIRYIVSAEQPFPYTESFRIVRTLPNPMSPQELTRCGTVYDRKNR